jgi:hypothetical protein
MGLCRHDDVHLRLVPKVVPFVFARGGKDVILLKIRHKVILALIRIVGQPARAVGPPDHQPAALAKLQGAAERAALVLS